MVFNSSRQKENMVIGIMLSIAIMWSFTAVYCGRPCAPNKVVNVRGFYQQNIDLVCNISRNCTRVFWERHRDGENAVPISDKCKECANTVSNNAVNGTNILHIQNLSGNANGVYTCYCEYVVTNSHLSSRSTEVCYNLTIDILECGMKTSINGQRTLTYNGNHLGHIEETLDANINDILTATCLNDENKKTNCSELEHPLFDIPLRSSDSWCQFSCTVTEGTATCKVSIILNVTAGLQSPSTTLLDVYSTTTVSSLHSTPKLSTVDYQNNATSNESSNEFYTIKPMTTSLELENMPSAMPTYSTAGQSTYKQLKTTLQHFGTGMLVTTSEEHSTEKTNQSIFQDKIMVSLLVALILMSTITTLLSVYIVITKKPCFVLLSQNEKWINPLYESYVHDRATPYAETEVSGVRLYGRTRHDQSLPCLDVVSIQDGRQFHSLGSLNITENKEPSWFTEKYNHGEAGNERVDGLVSHLNANIVTKLGIRSNLNENNSDIENDSFSSEEEEDPHPIIGLKERKERFTSLHIYEDANIGGTS